MNFQSSDLVGLRTGNRYRIEGAPVGRGGEAAVFGVAGSAHVAKIFHRPMAAELVAKLTLLTTRPPVAERCAWPLELLSDPGASSPVGYLMRRVVDAAHLHAYLHPGRRRRDQFLSRFRYDWLVRIAHNVAVIVDQVHQHRHVIGDLNSTNVLVGWNNGLPTLIDLDSLQYRDPVTGTVHRCCVARPEYLAPELQGRALKGALREPSQDLFALGVLIYQLLMEGDHPYRSRSARGLPDPPDLPSRIREGLFAFDGRRAGPSQLTLPWNLLADEVRSLLLRAFQAGHGDPAARPSAAEWRDGLRALLVPGRFRGCPYNSQHTFPSHVTTGCPWCDRHSRTGVDPYPPVSRPSAAGESRGRTAQSVTAAVRNRQAVEPVGIGVRSQPVAMPAESASATPPRVATKNRLRETVSVTLAFAIGAVSTFGVMDAFAAVVAILGGPNLVGWWITWLLD